MERITIMVPCYNEEETVPLFYDRIRPIIDRLDEPVELLFVNDGSTDGTLARIRELRERDPRVHYVDLSRNYGKEIAMAAGFDYARGDAVINIDCDLQDPPELIPEMIKYWKEGYDDVYAQRVSRRGESWLKRATAHAFYRLLSRLTSIPIPVDTGDYRLLSRRAVDALRTFRESQRYTKGLYSLVGFKKIAIPYEREPRAAGKTKWSYWKLLGLAVEGITTFTVMPLRISTFVGIFTSLASFIYIVYIVAKTLLYGVDFPGYASMASFVLFFGGLQLLALGILGEYVGRIFMETKRRPLYFVNAYTGETQPERAAGTNDGGTTGAQTGETHDQMDRTPS
jgi:glycosyltransferase involved in cell wall biosynthesis